ncbi:hypothetical protein LTR53_016092, partial [Teratosphaeriaceae sp. CCFEE 6253]
MTLTFFDKFAVDGFGVDGFGVDGFGVDGFGVAGFDSRAVLLRSPRIGFSLAP